MPTDDFINVSLNLPHKIDKWSKNISADKLWIDDHTNNESRSEGSSRTGMYIPRGDFSSFHISC